MKLTMQQKGYRAGIAKRSKKQQREWAKKGGEANRLRWEQIRNGKKV